MCVDACVSVCLFWMDGAHNRSHVDARARALTGICVKRRTESCKTVRERGHDHGDLVSSHQIYITNRYAYYVVRAVFSLLLFFSITLLMMGVERPSTHIRFHS